jgi:hypothetical protein
MMAVEPTYTVKKLIALTPAQAQAIAAYRFKHHIGAEAEAIRRLITLGLNTAAQQQSPESKSSGSKHPGPR